MTGIAPHFAIAEGIAEAETAPVSFASVSSV
jgi:hypothetical protein